MSIKSRYTKFKSVRIPPVQILDDHNRKPKLSLDDLLKPLDDLHFETSSNYSDISDMFEEQHKDCLINTKKNFSKEKLISW